MNTNRKWRASLLGLGAITAVTLLAPPAPAQGPGGGPPPDDMGRPPFDRPMDGQGRPPLGGPRPVSLANVPISALAAGLNLKGNQQDTITRLKQQARAKRQDAPGPPAQATEQTTTDGITGVLTDTQKQALPDLLQTFRALRAAGVPLILYADLKLTPAQSGQIKALASSDAAPPMGREARRQAQEKVMALLTDTQKEMVEEAREEARMMGGPPSPPPSGRFRGPGQVGPSNDRRGGPPPGGPGDDMGGGPPPPHDGGGPDGQMGSPPPGGPGGPPPDGGF